MRYLTDRKRAIGRGASGTGTEHHWYMTVSAVGLAGLIGNLLSLITIASMINKSLFNKLLLTLTDDIRVILIKIADRLHNMRTLDSMPRHKQLKIASETSFLYAPLAHRMGLYAIKSELEDLSMKYTESDKYRELPDLGPLSDLVLEIS